MYHPLVSVILPCYNSVDFIGEAIESIINQTYQNLEIIVIDDGSTDKSSNIIDVFASWENRIKVITNENNIGLIKSLNKGIELSSGEYIARMDADDISEPTRIEEEINYLIQHNLDIVSSAKILINHEGNKIGLQMAKGTYSEACNFTSFFSNPLLHPAVIARSQVFKMNPYLNASYTLHVEDYELWTRLLSHQFKSGNLNKPLHRLRINKNSISRKFEAIQITNFLICSKKHIENYFNTNLTDDIHCVIANRLHTRISFVSYRNGITLLKFFKKQFIIKENIREPAVIMQINNIISEQISDILLQGIKKCNFKIKFFSLTRLIFYIIYDYHMIKYLKHKLF